MNWPRTVGSREGKNLARHQAWLALLPCRTIHLEGWGDSIIPLFDLVVFISAVAVRRPVEKFFRFLMAPAARRYRVDTEMPSFTIA